MEDRQPKEVFQSAPLTDVRGDLSFLVRNLQAQGFQSAPLTDVRGDHADEENERSDPRFNPLPSLM